MIRDAQAAFDAVQSEIEGYQTAEITIPQPWMLARQCAFRWLCAGQPVDDEDDHYLSLITAYVAARYSLDLATTAYLLEEIEAYEIETGTYLTDEELEVAAGLSIGWESSRRELIETAKMPTLRRATVS
jgi:hypothetical protein